jgi:histidine triad (HIT) family protein
MCECIFCDIVKKKIDAKIIYEDEFVISFLDTDPINEGHVLLIPKEHYLDVDDLPKDLYYHIMMISKELVSAIKKTYKPNGYSIYAEWWCV